MPVDFRDAAERHWGDAGRLFEEDARLANADHLLGLSAECALKAVMCALGMTLGKSGAPQDKLYKVHINELWNEFVSFSTARFGARYAVFLMSMPNPFDDWHVNQRYEHRSRFIQTAVEKHREGAQNAKRILEQAVLDGVIP